MAVKVEHLVGEKMMESESLRDAFRKEEFVLAGLKIALALEEEEKKEAKLKVIELEAQLAKSILEVVARAIEELKTSPKMKDLNIAFSQKAFIKGFEFYEGRVARRFLELDLEFLEEEEEAGEEARPSSTRADLSSAEPSVKVPEPAESAPTSSTTAPSKVEDLE
ncbi:hypothetical protein COCNU_scaffold004692G000010 [Cocos nucifera]|nr:hypothetical protein [Cocos nucifera]